MTPSAVSHYAGFRRRLVAFLLDDVILAIFSSVIAFVIFGLTYFHTSGPDQGIITQSLIAKDYTALLNELAKESPYIAFENIMTYLVPVIVTVVCWKYLMATPGKLLTSCHVVDARSHQPISWTQAVLRYVGYILSTIPFGLGFLWVIWDKQKRGFHDMLARTVVIEDGDDLSQYSLTELAGKA